MLKNIINVDTRLYLTFKKTLGRKILPVVLNFTFGLNSDFQPLTMNFFGNELH